MCSSDLTNPDLYTALWGPHLSLITLDDVGSSLRQELPSWRQNACLSARLASYLPELPQSEKFFGFPVYIKVMFTLHRGPLSVQ